MKPRSPTALIAEDEPLLAVALQAALAQAWPDLRVLATVGDGVSAVAQALALQMAQGLVFCHIAGLLGAAAGGLRF